MITKSKTQNLEKVSDYVNINVKHVFTAEEKDQQADLLAQAVQDKASEEANKKVTMGTFKDKIDKLSSEIRVYSGHVVNGFTYRDEPCELHLDYDTNQRVYKRKQDGIVVKTEAFHPSDFQKKIDFTGISPETQDQIDFNNAVAGLSEKPVPKDNLPENYGEDFEPAPDALDEVIVAKVKKFKADKKSGAIKSKPLYPVETAEAIPEGMYIDDNGNLTDIPPLETE